MKIRQSGLLRKIFILSIFVIGISFSPVSFAQEEPGFLNTISSFLKTSFYKDKWNMIFGIPSNGTFSQSIETEKSSDLKTEVETQTNTPSIFKERIKPVPSSEKTASQTKTIRPQPQEISKTCTDSDGGVNAFKKGSVVLNAGGKTEQFLDKEMGTNGILEFSCNANGIRGEYIQCKNGVDGGVCKEQNCPTLTCAKPPAGCHYKSGFFPDGCKNPCASLICEDEEEEEFLDIWNVRFSVNFDQADILLRNTPEDVIVCSEVYKNGEITRSACTAPTDGQRNFINGYRSMFDAEGGEGAYDVHFAVCKTGGHGIDPDTCGNIFKTNVNYSPAIEENDITNFVRMLDFSQNFDKATISLDKTPSEDVIICSEIFKNGKSVRSKCGAPIRGWRSSITGYQYIFDAGGGEGLYDVQFAVCQTGGHGIDSGKCGPVYRENIFYAPEESEFPDIVVVNINDFETADVYLDAQPTQEIIVCSEVQKDLRIIKSKCSAPTTKRDIKMTGYQYVFEEEGEGLYELEFAVCEAGGHGIASDECGSSYKVAVNYQPSVEECVARGNGCCRGGICLHTEIGCPSGTTYTFHGCSETCQPMESCDPAVTEEIITEVSQSPVPDSTIIAGEDDVSAFIFSLYNTSMEGVLIEKMLFDVKGGNDGTGISAALFSDGIQQGSSLYIPIGDLFIADDISMKIPARGKKGFTVVMNTNEALAQSTVTFSLVDIEATTASGNTVTVMNTETSRPLSPTNFMQGTTLQFIKSGSLKVGLGEIAPSTVLVPGQTDVPVLNIRLYAKNDDILVQDLYFENDSNNDETPDNLGVAGKVNFKLYNPEGKLIQTKQMQSDGTVHFELPNQYRIVVPNDGNATIAIKVDVIGDFGGEKLRMSLDASHVTKGIKALTGAIGNDIAVPERGWETGPGAVTGEEFNTGVRGVPSLPTTRPISR